MIIRLAIILGVVAVTARAQEDPLAWFPLKVGARWVYDYEYKSGNRDHPKVDRSTIEETVTGQVAVPEGLVVLREVRREGNPAAPDTAYPAKATNGQTVYVHPNRPGSPKPAPYLIHGDCVYGIDQGWDAEKLQLRPDYQLALSEGEVSPDFCSPLQAGRAWGTNDIPWRVEPASEGSALFLPPQYAGAIHIFSSHFGSGGTKDVWFQKGAGVVGEHYLHHGTYDEYTKTLRSFSP